MCVIVYMCDYVCVCMYIYMIVCVIMCMILGVIVIVYDCRCVLVLQHTLNYPIYTLNYPIYTLNYPTCSNFDPYDDNESTTSTATYTHNTPVKSNIDHGYVYIRCDCIY